MRAGLAGVSFREFAWSGANTHAARLEVGDHPAQYLCDGHALDPDARHFVVAHRHGGNVALYAMRDAAARAVAAGSSRSARPSSRHEHAICAVTLTLSHG